VVNYPPPTCNARVNVFQCLQYNCDYLQLFIVSTRDYAIARMPRQSVRPSVCLSHAWTVSKRLNISSKFFHSLILMARAIILVFFCHQGCRVNLTASPLTGLILGRRIQGGSDFRRLCDYISGTVTDRSMTLDDLKLEFYAKFALSIFKRIR